MKNSLFLKVAVLAALLSGMPHSFPQASEAETAKHFVESLYVRYGPNGDPANLSGANANQFFDPSLVTLAKTLEARGSGYIGALTYDHLCNCTNTNVTFPNLRIVTDPVTKDRATATVTFTGNDGIENKILISLSLGTDQWRIYDIKDYSGPAPYMSLRGLLQSEINAVSKGHASQ